MSRLTDKAPSLKIKRAREGKGRTAKTARAGPAAGARGAKKRRKA